MIKKYNSSWNMKLTIFLLLSFIVASSCNQVGEDADTVLNNEKGDGRIPPMLKPLNYTVRLQPFINGNRSIHGRVEIDFVVDEPTDKIILNMRDILTLNETCQISVQDPSNETNPGVVKQTYENVFHQYVVYLDRNLTANSTGKISVDFRGYLNDLLVGFYLSTYKDDDGNIRKMASTQFSPTDARRAFPCFDEPVFKARFNMIMVHTSNMTAWSSMPVIKSVPIDNIWMETHFDTTPVMSTYFLGFMISDLVQKTDENYNTTKFSVLVRSNAVNLTDYASFMAPRCLDFLADYFQIEYPLPKLDMAAIPNFKFFGMENWGLIKYRESGMLYDDNLTTIAAKQDIARVIGHEIAHMWFGNLVTPEWWSELWLKEGFADYMGFLSVDHIEPSYNIMEYLVHDEVYSAMQLDSLKSSHPINVHVDKPDRISEIFDEISYSKGCSIIRMMHQFLTDDVFRNGMKRYLTELKYKNANQDLLWNYLSEAWSVRSDLQPAPLKTIMDTWTLQQGYPVINVKSEKDQIVLSQEPFTLEGDLLADYNSSSLLEESNDTLSLSESKWWVPITIATKSKPNFTETNPSFWLQPDGNNLSVPNIDGNWVVINVQKTGFYRVNYDDKLWNAIIQQLKANHSVFHSLNRAQFIDDSFNLAQAGILPYSTAFDISSYLKLEKDVFPWMTFLTNMDYAYTQAKFYGEVDLIKNYLRNMLNDIYTSVGFESKPDEPYERLQLRRKVVSRSCKAGIRDCLKKTKFYFDQWLNNPSSSFSSIRDIKPTVLCRGIEQSGAKEWNATFDRFLKSNVQTEKSDLLVALSCSNSTDQLQKFIDMAMNESSGIKKQDMETVFEVVASTPNGRNITWTTIKQKWNYIISYFPAAAKDILKTTTESFNTREQVEEMKAFYEIHKENIGSALQEYRQSLEKAVLNTAWTEKLFPSVMEAIYSKF